MRCYQEHGLTVKAENWLVKNCVVEGIDPCPHCGKNTKSKLKVLEERHADHFFTDGPTYKTYISRGGKKVKEIQQTEINNCGPCHFKCLELEDGIKIGEWTKEEMEETL